MIRRGVDEGRFQEYATNDAPGKVRGLDRANPIRNPPPLVQHSCDSPPKRFLSATDSTTLHPRPIQHGVFASAIVLRSTSADEFGRRRSPLISSTLFPSPRSARTSSSALCSLLTLTLWTSSALVSLLVPCNTLSRLADKAGADSGCFAITTVFSHAQTVVICGSCASVLCQPTGGKARLTEGVCLLFVIIEPPLIDMQRLLVPPEELSFLVWFFGPSCTVLVCTRLIPSTCVLYRFYPRVLPLQRPARMAARSCRS